MLGSNYGRRIRKMTFCKHTPHTVINWIKAPKYSTNEVLIDKNTVDNAEENILLSFTDEIPRNKYGWLHFNRDDIRRYTTQKNGRIIVYMVPLTRGKPFKPLKECDCNNIKLL